MHIDSRSSKLLDKLMNDDNLYENLQHIIDKDTDELRDLKQVAKIFMIEFNIKPDDWDKIILLLKIARSTK